MSTTPECAVEVPETEEDTPKESLPSQECHVNIGQGGADGGGGGGDDDDEESEVCRICYEGANAGAGALVALCRCKGSMGYTHVRCLERWLDTSQKTRCELCGYAYHLELTKRYAALPSLCIWARQQADTRLLTIDLLTVLFLTPVIGAYVYLSVCGILELSEGPAGVDPNNPNETTTERLTAIGLMVLCICIVICYIIWLCVTFSTIFNEWYAWWSSCFRIRVLHPKEEERDRRPAVVREEQGMRREPSLELIFSRGVLSNRQR